MNNNIRRWVPPERSCQLDEVEVIVERPREHLLKFKPFDLGRSARWLEQQRRKSLARIGQSPREAALIERITRLKREAGHHSPSPLAPGPRNPLTPAQADGRVFSAPSRRQPVFVALHPPGHP